MTALGIGDRLVISWIQQEPERAEQTAAYVEEKSRRKQIKGSTGGYARTVFESGSDLVIQASKEKLQPRRESTGLPKVDAAAEARAKAVSSAIKALDIKQMREFANAYLAQGGEGNSYSLETGKFSNVLERTAYTTWLRSTIAEKINSNQVG